MDEQEFWKWFERHHLEYLHLDDLDNNKKELLLDKFLKHLHNYCDKLYFQIGGNPLKERRELVISAEGNKKYFDTVEKLVNAAPELENWKVLAFKQPMGIDFVTNYEGLMLDPKKMWFLPLSNEQKPEMIGIRICIENYDSNNEKYKLGAYQILDTILGENAVATEIDYIDFDNLSNYNLENDGLIKLIELSKYITWKKH